MKRLILTTILGLALTTTAAAQEPEVEMTEEPLILVVPAAPDDDAARRLELAERYVELSQGDSLADMAQTYIDELLAADTQSEAAHREWFRVNLPREMTNLMTAIMDGLVPVFAERLTVEELTALVDFYETPLGRSIAQKQVEIGMDQGMAMEAAVLQFQLDLMRKFCTEFDCSEAAASGPRPDKQGVQRN
ncbi:MAG: hypothetical protein ACI8U3_001739 [Brevundimonas sp.]|jgi:hypothetical protein|uniref:DUF2059 domain-containing protein n=1 Tax=Brevundimonas sp. TaxID=1871086 RepID=UPI0039E516EF